MEETAGLDVARPPPSGSAAPGPLEDLVERWWADHFPGPQWPK